MKSKNCKTGDAPMWTVAVSSGGFMHNGEPPGFTSPTACTTQWCQTAACWMFDL